MPLNIATRVRVASASDSILLAQDKFSSSLLSSMRRLIWFELVATAPGERLRWMAFSVFGYYA